MPISARIRWRSLHLVTKEGAAILSPPALPLYPVQNEATCIFASSKAPEMRHPGGIGSFAATLCSVTKSLFAKLSHSWPIRHCSLRCLSWLVPRSPQVLLQWVVQRSPPRIPRRSPPIKQGSTRVSRTMARGSALACISAARRGVILGSWAAVYIKRREWLAFKLPLHRQACRYVGQILR